MSLRKAELNKILVNRIDFACQAVAMIACARCVVKQKQCRLSSLFRKCSKCVKCNKKCEPAVPFVNFNAIDRVMIKLKREELKTKTA